MLLSLYPQFSERLTHRSRIVLEQGCEYAEKTLKRQMEIHHIIRAITQEDGCLGYKLLATVAVKLPPVKEQPTGLSKKKITISEASQKALVKALHTAFKYKQKFIGTEHLLYGILTTATPASISKKNRETLIQDLEEMFESNSALGTAKLVNIIEKTLQIVHSEHRTRKQYPNKTSIRTVRTTKFPTLNRFCENITRLAETNSIDPLIGRNQELDRMVRILIRRTKNNPLLIGEPGVGKTTLVQGLALRIHEGLVPPPLLNKHIYALSLNNLVAGTTFRGEFEERMHELVKEASHNDILLFIDEIHTLIGAGSAQGSLDAANILKPALVNGAFQCIGATTLEEFRHSIEKDGALERRFQKVVIHEECSEKSIQTLEQLAPLYEKHHDVTIDKDIIALCVELSQRYLPHRALPDKAIDILDEAASKANSVITNKEFIQSLNALERKLQGITTDKRSAVENERYTKAATLKKEEDTMRKKIKEMQDASKKQKNTVQKDDVYAVVAEIASVPLESIHSPSPETMVTQLKKDIIGQDEAITSVVQALKRGYSGVRDVSRPVGSFLFCGESGVGKSHVAKKIASLHSNNKDALIQIDMSEFSESHTISRLIGAPAGYVGYEDAGFLTERIRKNPTAVVLFDEIEKAHPSVLNILLQILEEGALTDNKGKKSFFSNAIIVLTTNKGDINTTSSIGFTATQDTRGYLRSLLSHHIRPEILNRIDTIIPFNSLTTKNLQDIAERELALLNERLSISLSYTKPVATYIAKKAHKAEKGARGIRATIQEQIENEIADRIEKSKNIHALHVSTKRGELVFDTVA